MLLVEPLGKLTALQQLNLEGTVLSDCGIEAFGVK